MKYQGYEIEPTPEKPFVLATQYLCDFQIYGFHFCRGDRVGVRIISGIPNLEKYVDQLCKNSFYINKAAKSFVHTSLCRNNCRTIGLGDKLCSKCEKLEFAPINEMLSGWIVNISLPPLTIECGNKRIAFDDLSDALKASANFQPLTEVSIDIYCAIWNRLGAAIHRIEDRQHVYYRFNEC